MDDDCYINNKKVPVAELGKWLPDISESNADQLGGHCETILCFDKDRSADGLSVAIMILSTAGLLKSTVGLVNLTIGGIRPLLVSLQYFFGQVHS